MARIIVLGAGLGGMSAAYEIRAAIGSEHAVTVVGEGGRFSFTPSNPWVAIGWRKPADIQIDVVGHLAKKNIDFDGTGARRVDPARNIVTLNDGRELAYDHLVICTGPRLAFDEVPGLGPHGGHSVSICTTDHAAAAWLAYEEFLKNPGPVVIGAAPGTSCFGPAYEFAMMLDADLRKRKLRDRVPMTYITPEPYIGHMGLGGVGDSKSLLESEMRQRHIKWIANARITEVLAGSVKATELDERGNVLQEHEVAQRFAMIMPPFTGVDAVRGIEGLVNPRGFVLIDQHQRHPTFKNVWSAGVCVAIPPVEVTVVPTGAPKTGFMIESMVTAIAHNIAAVQSGREPDSVPTWNAICLADMGDTGAAFVALPQFPPRNVTWAKVGKWVHVAKVAFEKYFLRKMRTGNTDPVYEKYVLKALGIERLK